MAYGRLDVFYPDGNFRSFPLEEGKVSVGRSPGNTITLETETISRYHFSITNEGGDIRLMDMESQNGTYIDGLKIPQEEPYTLRGGEEIIVGDLRIIYHEVDESPTQPVRPGDGVTQRIEQKDVPFQLSIQPPPIAIPPGAHASAELTITNTGDEKGFYSVEVEGIDRNWVRVDRPRLLVDPGESTQVIINVRPARRSATAPGEYSVNVSVREDNTPGAHLEAQTHVRVLPYSGFGIALERKHITANERFRLHVHNQGSADLPLSIGGSERNEMTTIELMSSPNVVLQPGQRLVIQGKAQLAKRRLVGGTETQPFDIVVRTQDPSQFMAVVRGKVTHAALLPVWALGVIVGGLVVLAIGLAGLLGLVTAPDPQIASLEVAATRVERGELLEIQWQAEDVTDLTLLINETPHAELDPASSSYTLETTALPDTALISIAGGTNRRQAEPQSRSVRIYDPMQLVSFQAQPPELVRFVVQPLSLNWNIANADFVQVNGLDVFTTGEVPSGNFEPEDSLEDVLGIPMDDLTITLYAEDDLGNSFTYSQVIEAAVPQCTPADEAVPLRSGPNPLNQQVGTVPAEATVVVDARDLSGAWVRVQLEAGLTGWGALDAFTCSDQFNPAELRQEINVTPPPTEPPTLTPVPTEVPGTPSTPGSTVPASTPTPQPTTAG